MLVLFYVKYIVMIEQAAYHLLFYYRNKFILVPKDKIWLWVDAVFFKKRSSDENPVLDFVTFQNGD